MRALAAAWCLWGLTACMVPDLGPPSEGIERRSCEDDADCRDTQSCMNGFCFADPGETFCGDGIVQDGEGCDDANEVDTDACTNACQAARCGDGALQAGVEACDDGNEEDGDACTTQCSEARCGDGVHRTDLADGDPGFEACDDGNDDESDACLSGCTVARCGDGVLRTDLGEGDEGFEACDDGNDRDADACTNACAPARCGDGIRREDLDFGDEGFEFCDRPAEGECIDNCSRFAFVKVAAGDGHTCGQIADGTVACWGQNSSSQLGRSGSSESEVAQRIAGLTHVVDLAVGNVFGCALLSDGQLACWGSNAVGQILGSEDVRTWQPAVIEQLGAMDRFGLGAAFGCAQTRDQGIRCWGENRQGQLGGGVADDTHGTLRPGLPEGATVQGFGLGQNHACMMVSGGSSLCWGYANSGQLGRSDISTPLVPAPVEGLTNPQGISAGHGHTCAWDERSRVWCWGSNTFSQLGVGRDPAETRTPIQVEGLTSQQVSARGNHTCALVAQGRVRCWGMNIYGQVGAPGNGNIGQPFEVRFAAEQPLSGATQISLGQYHSCARLNTGSIACWGYNNAWQLGTRSPAQARSPVLIPPPPP